jgi:hypothetical protein
MMKTLAAALIVFSLSAPALMAASEGDDLIEGGRGDDSARAVNPLVNATQIRKGDEDGPGSGSLCGGCKALM